MKAIISAEYKTFFKEIKERIQTRIPERLLAGHYAERHPQSFGKREVMLSLYLTGK